MNLLATGFSIFIFVHPLRKAPHGLVTVGRFLLDYSRCLSASRYAFTLFIPYLEITSYSSVLSIGIGTFSSCIELSSVVIGRSVTTIKNSAFSECSELSNVSFLGTSDPGKASKNVFDGCVKLSKIPPKFKN